MFSSPGSSLRFAPAAALATALLLGESVLGTATLHPTADAAELARPVLDRIDVGDLKRRVQVLAGDALEGRQAGTRGGKAAAAFILTEFRQLRLQPAGASNDFRQTFGRDYANILGRLAGRDARPDADVIVVGAHYDHVGYGNSSNSYGPLGQIHNGADDNASGVAALLEIADALVALPQPPQRTILFACWDGEEAGLLGSQYWTTAPTVPLRRIRLAVNCDMLGRLRNEQVAVMGWRTAVGLRPLITDQNGDTGLQFRFDPAVTDDSDHYPFYAARIPVLHFDTGKHEDYHRPSDDVDKLNYAGLLRLTQFLTRLVYTAAEADELPAFRPEVWGERPAPKLDPLARSTPPVRFGVGWDPQAAERGEFLVVHVVSNSAAAQAGLRKGDRLLQFGAWRAGVGDVPSLRLAINTAAEPVPIRWQSPGAETVREGVVTLSGAPIRAGLTYRLDGALPGAGVVTEVVETSPADQAGVQPGDVLVSLGDQALPRPEEFLRRLDGLEGEVALQIERAGRRRRLSLIVPGRASAATPAATVSE